MKKSLMIVSFAFIFLLTMSVISAGLWITGDVGRTIGTDNIATSVGGKTCSPPCESGDSCVNGECVSGTAGVAARSVGCNSEKPCAVGTCVNGVCTRSVSARQSGVACPSGFSTVSAMGGGSCCVKTSSERGKRMSGRILGKLFGWFLRTLN